MSPFKIRKYCDDMIKKFIQHFPKFTSGYSSEYKKQELPNKNIKIIKYQRQSNAKLMPGA